MFSVNTVIHQPGTFAKEQLDGSFDYQWPQEGLQVIPDWIYTSNEIYQREIERIFHGRTWNFVALEAEIPEPGDFKRSYVGPTPVVVARDADGSVHVFENRCAHRGAEFCRAQRGNTKEFVCPYHQWSYDLKGNLQGVPFKRGVKGEGGGMPKDFRNEDHGLMKLNVTRLHGVVFASFARDLERGSSRGRAIRRYLWNAFASVWSVLTKQSSSTIFAVCGSSSLTHAPDRPCCANANWAPASPSTKCPRRTRPCSSSSRFLFSISWVRSGGTLSDMGLIKNARSIQPAARICS